MTDADLMLLNGRIATLDRGNTVVHALAARDGRIPEIASFWQSSPELC